MEQTLDAFLHVRLSGLARPSWSTDSDAVPGACQSSSLTGFATECVEPQCDAVPASSLWINWPAIAGHELDILQKCKLVDEVAFATKLPDITHCSGAVP